MKIHNMFLLFFVVFSLLYAVFPFITDDLESQYFTNGYFDEEAQIKRLDFPLFFHLNISLNCFC